MNTNDVHIISALVGDNLENIETTVVGVANSMENANTLVSNFVASLKENNNKNWEFENRWDYSYRSVLNYKSDSRSELCQIIIEKASVNTLLNDCLM